MKSTLKQVLLLVFLILVSVVHAEKLRVAPFKDYNKEAEDVSISSNVKKRVTVTTVALFTLAMAGASGLGAIPFFFVELDPQWERLCNGMAAGVMIAASFDFIQEGQAYGHGTWVVFGILSGALFIAICKKVLDEYGEVSMLDIKGADAAKVVLVVGIMTLHAFGEGAGVGVSFACSRGLTQGLLVTLAIAVHNIPEGLAVSMMLASRGVSPLNAMFWSVLTSLPQVYFSRHLKNFIILSFLAFMYLAYRHAHTKTSPLSLPLKSRYCRNRALW